MKKGVLLLAFLLVGFLSFGQTFQWAYGIGGNFTEVGSGIAIDANSNIITAGNFWGFMDFDPDPSATFMLTSNGSHDIYISKSDSNGNFQWAKSLGGTGYDRALDLVIDDVGNIIITGFFRGLVDFDPGVGTNYLNSAVDGESYVLKLDHNGNFLWAKSFGGTGGRSVTRNINGDIIVAGHFSDTADFDPGPGISNLATNGLEDIFILRIDSIGNFIWAKGFGGISNDNVNTVLTDSIGNSYCAGIFLDSADFDPGGGVVQLISNGMFDGFINKLDSNGNLVWVKSFGGSSSDYCYDICLGTDDNIVATGFYTGAVDFDPSPSTHILTAANGGAYILKINSSGIFIWAKNFVGGVGRSVAIDNSLSIYTLCGYSGLVDMDPGISTFYTTNSVAGGDFVSKLDSNGSFISGRSYDNGGAIDIITGSPNMYYLQGLYSVATNFNPGPTSFILNPIGGTSDIFVAKFQSCNNPSYDTIISIGCDTSINGILYSRSGVYVQLFVNFQGCDSFLTLDLTILNSNDTLSYTSCDSLALNGQTFTSSGSYTQVLTNANGCDSTLTINLTLNNTTYSVDTIGGCDSVTVNNQTYNASGQYTQILTNASGCDSILTLNIGVLNSPTNSFSYTACDSLIVYGQTYTTSGTYLHVLPNPNACDTMVTLNLTINPSPMAMASANGLVLSAGQTGGTYQWINCNPYQIIAGATNQTYTATANGDYAVIVTQNGCSDTSNCISFTNVGIDVISLNRILVRPNPIESLITISSTNNLKNANLQILNSIGQVVYRNQNISGTQIELDISKFANGLYILEVIEDKNVSRVKVMKR